MKQRFGRNRMRKDGTPGKIVERPPIVELHSSVRFLDILIFILRHTRQPESDLHFALLLLFLMLVCMRDSCDKTGKHASRMD